MYAENKEIRERQKVKKTESPVFEFDKRFEEFDMQVLPTMTGTQPINLEVEYDFEPSNPGLL